MKKIYYTLCLVALSATSVVNAQTLSQLRVKLISGGKANAVVGFNAASAVRDYTVTLSSTQTYVPEVDPVWSATDFSAVTTQAVSIDGTEAERTATVVVSLKSDPETTTTYTVTFIKSDNFIEGFTEDALATDSYAGSFLSVGDLYNHGEQVGNRCIRTGNNANSAYWTLPELVNGAGKLTFYITKDTGGQLLSTLEVKKSSNGTNWTTIATYVASTYAFPTTTGEWNKEEIDINLDGPAYVQIAVTKTGTARDFGFDDVVITPYSTSTSLLPSETTEKDVIYAANGKIHIEKSNADTQYSIYDIAGRIVKEGNFNNSIAVSIEKGVYIVKTNSATKKVTVQ